MDDKRELASSIGQVEKPEGSSVIRGHWAVCLLALGLPRESIWKWGVVLSAICAKI